MQVVLELVFFAVAMAILIIVVLAVLGVSVSYREEIVRRKIDTYARIIVTPALLVVTIYLYIQGILNSDALFMSIVFLLPILLCTDWPKLQSIRKADSAQETENDS